MPRYSPELKTLAKARYIKGYTVGEISKELKITERTLYNWRDADEWQQFAAPDTVEQAIARRVNALIEKENKTAGELAEFESLVSQLGNLQINIAQASKLQAEAVAIANGTYIPPEFLQGSQNGESLEKDGGNKQATQGAKKKRKKSKTKKNDLSHVTPEILDEIREKIFFDYQKLWYEKKNDPETRRNRFILKSRQIGATYYFAFEALDDAIRTGDNQIFLSASRDQAEVFKAYIVAFAAEHFDVELKGQGCIKLSNGAELRFLSTNSATAQSYHGHLYLDEVFWIPGFKKLWKVASGMAAHKKWRRTLFSTPSAMSHEAYPKWSGDEYNKGKAENKKQEFDLSHKTLSKGFKGADRIWRHMVTVKDAEAQGCNLFDIEELQDEYNKDDFNNLFLCKFIDDAKSVFSLNKLIASMVDPDTRTDYNPDAARPFGNRPVAIGFDPSRTRDNSSIVVLSIPLKPGEKWRLLKRETHKGVNFKFQANRIKDLVDTHNVQHIGIDVTGIGLGVFELVQEFYPRASPITYSVQTKTALVVKAIDVIENDLFEYNIGDKEVTQAFLMITKTTTPSNNQITYSATRSNTAGHADVAWATMHAFNYEDIAPRRATGVAFSHH